MISLMMMMIMACLAVMILTVVAVEGGPLGASGHKGDTATTPAGRLVGAPLRRLEAAGAADGPGKLPTLQELQERLQRGHDERGASRDEGRTLIYNGKPTGGSKYPFLVSMWLGTSPDVRLAFCLVPCATRR